MQKSTTKCLFSFGNGVFVGTLRCNMQLPNLRLKLKIFQQLLQQIKSFGLEKLSVGQKQDKASGLRVDKKFAMEIAKNLFSMEEQSTSRLNIMQSMKQNNKMKQKNQIVAL